MSLDANNIDDGKVDTSALTSLIKNKSEKKASPAKENNDVPNKVPLKAKTHQGKPQTKSSSDVRTPFDGPSHEELKRVSDRIANQVSKNQLSPTKLAQLSMLRLLSDEDGLIRKSQKEIAEHLGFKDRKTLSKVIKFFCDKGKMKIIKPSDAKKQVPAVYKLLDGLRTL